MMLNDLYFNSINARHKRFYSLVYLLIPLLGFFFQPVIGVMVRKETIHLVKVIFKSIFTTTTTKKE